MKESHETHPNRRTVAFSSQAVRPPQSWKFRGFSRGKRCLRGALLVVVIIGFTTKRLHGFLLPRVQTQIAGPCGVLGSRRPDTLQNRSPLNRLSPKAVRNSPKNSRASKPPSRRPSPSSSLCFTRPPNGVPGHQPSRRLKLS